MQHSPKNPHADAKMTGDGGGGRHDDDETGFLNAGPSVGTDFYFYFPDLRKKT